MTKTFRKGDRVRWSSHGGEAVGVVEDTITTETDAAGRHVVASKDEPQSRRPRHRRRARPEPSAGTISPRRSTRSCSPTPARASRCALRANHLAFADAINSEQVAEPVLAALLGCIGLVAVLPLTAVLSSVLVARLRRIVNANLNSIGR